MSDKESLQASEAQIAVHWQEEELYYPSAEFIAQANMPDPAMHTRFNLDNFPQCFKEYADLLSWDQYWHTMLDTSDPPSWKWFVGGKINASYNCVAPAQVQEQSSIYLCSRAGKRSSCRPDLSGAI